MNTINKKHKKTAYKHLFRLSHWLLGTGMLLLIITGYGIHSVSMPAWALFERYPSFYPGMRMIHWHKIMGIVFAPATIIALIYFLPKLKKIKLSNLRRIATILLLGAGVACVITSLGLIYTNIPSWLYHLARFIHSVSGMLIAPIAIIIHIYLALFNYFPLLIQSFAPLRQARWPQVIWLLIGLIVSWAIFTRFINIHTDSSEFFASRIGETVFEARQIDTLLWEKSKQMRVKLVNGVGYEFGVTKVSLRALHNGEHIFMKIQWEDEVYNRNYRPWVKTNSGWIQMNPGGADEVIYNEDKIALVFPINEDVEFRRYGCAVYCHNNQKTGRGQHWTAKDNPVDIWHWKSVRMDPIGYVDDKYWQGTDKISMDQDARHGDPGDGGYANNRIKGVLHPMMLPASADAIVFGALFQSKSVIYTKASDEKLPEGFIVPGVIVYNAKGDRADIKCYSTYRNNVWTLRIMRKLDTGSEYDVLFEPGKKYDFTLAAFDHNANRHSYNHQVYRLYIED